jgi:MFS family permease
VPRALVTEDQRVDGIFAAVRQVMANRALRRVAAGWLASVAAEWTFVVALLVSAHAFGGVIGVAGVTAARMLPAAFLAPVVAGVADRMPRARVLLLVHVVRGALMGVAAAGSVLDLPALVVAAAVVEGIAAVLNRPTTLSLQPQLARSPSELIAANAITSTGEAIGVLVGPAIGGIMLAVGGAPPAMLAGTLGFAAAALALLPVARDATRSTAPGRRPMPAARAGLAGYASVLRYRSAWLLVALFTAQTLVRGAFTVLLVAASIELLGLGRSGVGFLTAMQGAGAVFGAVVAFSLVGGRRLAATFTLCLALWGLPIALIGAMPVAAVAFIGLGVIGAANALLDVAGFTLMLRSVPDTLRARLFGLFEALVGIAVTIGSLAAPLLVAGVGLPVALMCVGLLLPLLALVTASQVAQVQATTAVPERDMALVRGIPLFAPLSLAAQERVAGAMHPHSAAAGEAVVQEGGVGDAYYAIVAGRAEVRRGDELLRTLGPGEAFGETALVRDVPRTATVRALVPLVLRRLERAAFLEAIGGTPGSALEAERVAAAHLAADPVDGRRLDSRTADASIGSHGKDDPA